MHSAPSPAGFELSTNLAQLPYGLFAQLANQLEQDELWKALFSDTDRNSPYNLRYQINDMILLDFDQQSRLLIF